MKKIFQHILLTFILTVFLGANLSPVFAEEENTSTETALESLRTKNVIEQSDEDICQPRLLIRKGMFVKWALRSQNFFGEKQELEPFQDVENDPYIAAAWQRGALLPSRIFEPQGAITIPEALDILLKLRNISISRFPATQRKWSDLPEDPRLGAAVFTAVKLGVWHPMAEGILGVQKNLTCLTAAELIQKAQEIPESALEGPQDALKITSPEEKGFTLHIRKAAEPEDRTEKLDYILNILNTKFLHKDGVETDKLVDAAIKAVLEKLEDKHTVYFDKEEQQEFLEGNTPHKVQGIGAMLRGEEEAGTVIITRTFPDSPAQRAGIRAGDLIIAVDDQDVTGQTAKQVALLVRGEVGTTVKIRVRRGEEERNFFITRYEFDAPFSEIRIEENIPIITLFQFEDQTVRDFSALMEKYNNFQSFKGLILDLRGNPGGAINDALKILGFFLPPDEKGKNAVGAWIQEPDALLKQRVIGEGELQEIPLVVLVDENSASASELLAGAIQDHKRGVVIGHQTFGKGTAQQYQTFNDGTAWKYTFANWLTPLQKNIDGIGITPDLIINDSSDKKDIVLERAKDLIKKRLIRSLLGK